MHYHVVAVVDAHLVVSQPLTGRAFAHAARRIDPLEVEVQLIFVGLRLRHKVAIDVVENTEFI